jgi:squalene monooxygenase
MPNSWLPAHPQHRSSKAQGCLLIGDALNMRHPLTGGGMTVGLGDAVILTELLGAKGDAVIDLRSADAHSLVREAAERWYWRRKGLTGTINVLAQALYSLFSAEGALGLTLHRRC